MAPIRVGIIGLSAVTDFSGAGSWTAGVHLPALRSLPDKYEIVALANSSVESAKRSAEFHKFPSSVKTYGSPEDIANDPDVDLVLVSVAVGKHYALAKPALQHKKKVVVEWPLGASIDEAQELTQLAKDGGLATAVGVQARASPLIKKIKEIIAHGQIGDISSSTLTVGSSLLGANTISEGWAYYVNKDSGGTFFTINFGHVVDAFVQVHGDIPKPQAIFKTHSPTVKLINASGDVVDPAFPQTSPDHIFVQGLTDRGVVSSLTFRRCKSASEASGLRWVITGTEGELLITGAEMGLSMGGDDLQARLTVGNEPAQTINLSDESSRDLPPAAHNVRALWDAFADGDTSKYATFESAASSHRLLERVREAAESY